MICESCGVTRTDCDCGFRSSDSIDIKGSGSLLNPFYAESIVDPDPDNLYSCAVDGQLVALPDAINDPPRCLAYNSAAISIPTDDRTVVDLDSERYDTHTMHDLVTRNSRIVAPIDGIYIITFSGSFAANVTGDRGAYIRKNGHEYMAMQQKHATNSASIETGMNVSVVDFLEAGEFIEALVQQDGAATLNLLATRYSPVLTMTYRRRTPFDD